MSKTRVHDMTLIFGGMTLAVVLILLDCPIADAITVGLALTAILILMDMRGDHNGTGDHTR